MRPDGLVFNQPFLPVPGNHDYYDLSWPVALLAGLTLPLRRYLQWFDDVDAGWRGSKQGEAYARVFLDVLNQIPPARLQRPSRVALRRCLGWTSMFAIQAWCEHASPQSLFPFPTCWC